MKPITVTDATFEQHVIKSDKLTVVDFWAEWCGPCRMIAPVLDELAKEYNDKVKFTKLNVDENPQTAMEFAIRSIPTLLVFQNGNVVDTIIGAIPKAQIKARLDRQLTVNVES